MKKACADAAEVFIDGRLPRGFRLPRAQLAQAARYFAFRSSARAGVPFREVTVVLQDDAASDAAHRAIMSVPGATDVITQGYDALPGEPPGIYGELYVNGERALAVASGRRDWSPEQELLLYIAHGMDHLAGEDDQTAHGYARMRRRELAWLRDYRSAGLGRRTK